MRRALPSLLLAAGTALLFLGWLGRLPLLGRDEALYAEAAREMLASGDWITPRVNGAPFFEKPPLCYWLTALSYRAFGVSAFSARLPAALTAVVTVLLTARLAGRVWGRRAGLLAGLALATCLQMAVIGRLGIMDVPLTLLTVLAVLCYERWQSKGGPLPAAGFGVCCGLGVLTKGAAGLIPASPAAISELMRVIGGERRYRLSARAAVSAITGALVPVAVAAPWFLSMNALHGQAFRATFLLREHLKRLAEPMQGHGGGFWYYLPIIAIGFFPWAAFLAGGVRRPAGENEEAARWRVFAIIWALAVVVPFSLVRTKLPGYVTPLFPALALLAGAEMDRQLSTPGRVPWVAAAAGAMLLAGLVALLPEAGARLGARVGAAQGAGKLVMPAMVWALAYAIVAAGALIALRRSPCGGLVVVSVGQAAAVGALLLGVLPITAPYLGGGSASLAARARQEMPEARIILYETHPETVNFVLHRSVPTFDEDEHRELMAALQEGPAALIAPAQAERRWRHLGARVTWRAGDRVLLYVIPGAGRLPEEVNEGGQR